MTKTTTQPRKPRKLPDPFKEAQALAKARRAASTYQRHQINELIAEAAKRQCEALRIFEPLPHIEPFHACMAPRRILRGSNRSGKAQPVDEPVLTPDGWRPIGKLEVGDVLIGGDGKPCTVTGVHPQGVKPIFRLTFGDGATTRCCEEHLWKVKMRRQRFGSEGGWVVKSLADIRSECGDNPDAPYRPVIPTCVAWMPRRTTPIDPYVLGIMLGDGCLRNQPAFSTADEEVRVAVEDSLADGLRLRKQHHPGKVSYDYIIGTPREDGGWNQRNPFKEACRYLGIWGKSSWEKGVPRDYLFNSVDVRLAVLQGLMDTDGTITQPHGKTRGWGVSFSTTSRDLAKDVAFLVRSLGGRCSTGKWSEKSYTYKGEKRTGRPAVRLFIRLFDYCPFRLRRKAAIWEEWRSQSVDRPRVLRKVEPDGEAECVCIAVSSPDHTYVTNDLIVTHNTIHASVEFARAVTGRDPYDKYPKKNGRAFVVGASGQHISEVLYRKIFRAGAFRMIKDGAIWRAFRPWDPVDQAREKEAKPAPPLIPPRMISTISWENKKEQIPAVVRLKNGWEIRFFSSQGIPPQGSDVDLVWFDEEIVHPLWFSEVAARGTVDRKGRFYWSATAQKGGAQLFELCEQAEKEKQENAENPHVVEVFAHINENKHFTDEMREGFFKDLSEEERLIRIEGEFAFTHWKVYPEFDRHTHGIDWFQIPSNWTRYMVVDPGRQVCAVLFAAVPPPDYIDPGCVILYDELYIRNSTAKAFGEEVRKKAQGQEFYAFIIDHQGGRVRDAGKGLTIEEQYSEELKRNGVKSKATGYGFLWGSTDVKAGLEKVRSWLLVRETGKPKLLYMHDRMYYFWHEMTRYRYKQNTGGLKDLKEEPEKRNDHLCDTLRALAMYDPRYHKPSMVGRIVSGVHERLKHKKRSNAKMHGTPGISLGGVGG